MNKATYRKLTNKELLGRKVVTLAPIANTLGTEMFIEGRWDGFQLVAERCPHCHFAPRAIHVPASHVDLVEGD